MGKSIRIRTKSGVRKHKSNPRSLQAYHLMYARTVYYPMKNKQGKVIGAMGIEGFKQLKKFADKIKKKNKKIKIRIIRGLYR